MLPTKNNEKIISPWGQFGSVVPSNTCVTTLFEGRLNKLKSYVNIPPILYNSHKKFKALLCFEIARKLSPDSGITSLIAGVTNLVVSKL